MGGGEAEDPPPGEGEGGGRCATGAAGSVLAAAGLAWVGGARDVRLEVNWVYFRLSPVRLVALITFHCSLRASKAADFHMF